MIKYTGIDEMISEHEGYSSKIYRCTSGKRSIGFGRNLDDCGISKDEAELMLKNDIKLSRESLEKGADYYNGLNSARQAVLIDMVFNLGWPRFSKFRKMAQALRHGYYAEAAYEMLDSRWSTQVGRRAVELSEMMRTGEWPEV